MTITFKVADVKCSREIPNSQKKDDSVIAKSSLPNRIPKSNGFVNTICDAYNQHYNLVLRPDDVWLAILCQFSNYVQPNAEFLRDKFVSHEGKKQLTVCTMGTLRNANYSLLSKMMSEQIGQNIKDPSVKDWVIPRFTTTTDNDVVCGSIVLMATTQAYFAYRFHLCCGLPQVTLEGTVDDWKEIEKRAERLVEFDNPDKHLSRWYPLLQDVLSNFTKSSKGEPDLKWWNRVCSYTGGGSGPTYLSGWVTVFCFFNEKGEPISNTGSLHHGSILDDSEDLRRQNWSKIDTNNIPSGIISTDLVIDDNGTEYQCTISAGHSASLVLDSQTVQPSVDWILKLRS